MNLLQLIQKNRVFLFAYTAMFVAAVAMMAMLTKTELFLLINGNHNPFLDIVFRILTEFGNGWFFFFIMLIFLFVSYGKSLIFAGAFILQTIIIQSLKHFVFPDFYRPVKYFNDTIQIHLIQGIEIHKYHSFPSGHSASIFCLITLLVFLYNRKKLSVLLLILAVFVSLSRVYLAQHFFEDIVFGSVIGVSVTIFIVWLSSGWISDRTWTEKKLSFQDIFSR